MRAKALYLILWLTVFGAYWFTMRYFWRGERLNEVVLLAMIIIGCIVLLLVTVRVAIYYLSSNLRAQGETDENDGNESVANARRADMPDDST